MNKTIQKGIFDLTYMQPIIMFIVVNNTVNHINLIYKDINDGHIKSKSRFKYLDNTKKVFELELSKEISIINQINNIREQYTCLAKEFNCRMDEINFPNDCTQKDTLVILKSYPDIFKIFKCYE